MTETATDTADRRVKRDLRRIRRAQRLRNRELILLIFAVALTVGAFTLVQLGALGTLDLGILAIAVTLCALAVALHIVLRIRASQADPFLLPVALLLTGLGTAMIYRIDLAYEANGIAEQSNAGAHQLLYAMLSLGLCGVLVWLLTNYRVLFRYTYIFGLTGVVLLILPFMPFLNGGGNAVVWVSLGGMFAFQPGEIAKICLAIFFAGYLVRTRESLASTGRRVLGFTFPRAREFGPLLVIWLISMGIIVLQRDLGTGYSACSSRCCTSPRARRAGCLSVCSSPEQAPPSRAP